MVYIFYLAFAIAFFTSLIFTPLWIKRAKAANLVGKDIHKPKQYPVAEIGGLPVMVSTVFAILVYVAIKTFFLNQTDVNATIMASLATLLLITIIGLIDDILGWKIGLKQWQKPVLTFLAALPLVVINSGVSTIALPFFGLINLGVFYPLVVIPLLITIFSNAFNMLAGYNGLEAGQGIIILSTLSYITWTQGSSWVAMLSGCAVFALMAFLFYNKYPAKVFPGDTLTYPIGALIAIVAILGNAEKIALILLIPYIIEFILKARGKFKKESFAKLNKDGSLALRYDKLYGLEHVMIYLIGKFKKVREYDVVISLWLFQLIFVVIGLLIL